jgi:nucleotide-binding universal stress UspA family protein
LLGWLGCFACQKRRNVIQHRPFHGFGADRVIGVLEGIGDIVRMHVEQKRQFPRVGLRLVALKAKIGLFLALQIRLHQLERAGALGFVESLGRNGEEIAIKVVNFRIKAAAPEHLVIGWKETREARGAVQHALPFLQEAARVTIVEICERGEERNAEEHITDVARYLTRHRIKSVPRVLLNEQGSGAAQLIKLARDEGADLLVTGAYGHSRLGEWIFGGMTRDLLTTRSICCLMSH